MSFYRWQRIVAESLPLLLAALLVELLAGRLLLAGAEALLETTALLALLPLLNATGGNLGVILGARLSSGLHGGTIEPNLRTKPLWQELTGTGLLGLLSYTLLAILIYLGALIMNLDMELGLTQLMIIMVGTGLLLTFFVLVASVVVALMAYKRGLDPDNLIPPVVTTGCDLVGVAALVLLVGVLL